jgi:hypothetical protein
MSDMYQEMNERVSRAILEKHKWEPIVHYSAYSLDDDDEPVDNLDEVAVRGRVVLVAGRSEYFGGKASKSYRSEVMHSPTWLQVAVCADEAIHSTRDEHHVFLEALSKKGKEEDVTIYEMALGS